MDNLELARLLEEIAELLEIKGENPYKIRAYRRGARAVALLSTAAAELASRGELERVEGIGKALAAKIEEAVSTGRIEYLERLREEIPPGLIGVMKVPGIGPKLAKRLYDEIGVRDLDDLARAVEEERLRTVRGLGPKAEANIARGLCHIASAAGRTPLGVVLPEAEGLAQAVRAAPGVLRAEVSGSLRRWAETVKDIDIVAAAEDSAAVMEHFVTLPQVAEVIARGPTKSSVRLRSGIQADLRVVSPPSYAAALHHFTGSKEHHVRLRELAQKRGLSISEYGLKRVETGERLYPGSEEELYGLLGLAYIPPELREGRGEIERALEGSLPSLITLDDIRGDLHVHSTWSDGRSEIAEMARAARKIGREYIAICDHSQALRIARGLTADDLRRQRREIESVLAESGEVRLLSGVEVDILADGSLDLDEEILSELDWVVASIHSGFRGERGQLTERLVRAMENPFVDAIGHPTGRILGQRPAYDIDFGEVVEAAVWTGTALEINASPDRLDLSDILAREAKEAGAHLVINTDAHHVDELGLMAFGVFVARRAWLEAADVVNTWPLEEIIAWRKRRIERTRR